MAFTIEVKKKEKDEEFSFEDLAMFHKECYGGRMRIQTDPSLKLICQRCRVEVALSSLAVAEIVRTAMDGQERKGDWNWSYGVKTHEITVIQRGQSD